MKHKSYMHKQGDSWVVGIWDNRRKIFRESQGYTYWAARAAVGRENCRNPEKCRIESHNH